jgi:hypothetical protein
MRIMGINTTDMISTGTDVYASYGASSSSKTDSTGKADSSAKEEVSEGVVYEKSADTADTSKATYSINKMSAEDRAALISQLKADQESRQNQLKSIVEQMLSKQAGTWSLANSDSDDIWKFIASGEYTVDEAAKAQAQQDISEDGYYGVSQTSQRMFDFASALAGDDVDKMKEMQEAMQEGFKQATAAWGKDLPDICQQTLDAANQLFEDYYASRESGSTEE